MTPSPIQATLLMLLLAFPVDAYSIATVRQARKGGLFGYHTAMTRL